ncbi:hypothetical protein VTI74DRAFT_484 [Chaetomium olivicolor]
MDLLRATPPTVFQVPARPKPDLPHQARCNLVIGRFMNHLLDWNPSRPTCPAPIFDNLEFKQQQPPPPPPPPPRRHLSTSASLLPPRSLPPHHTNSSPPISRPSLLQDLPENEPWPPVPPNFEFSALDVETPELSVTANCMIYRIKGQPSKVFKFGSEFREYQLQKAAGNCAIPVCGKVIGKPKIGNGSLFFYGFMMDLATPISTPGTVPASQRRSIMHQMIRIVERLHTKHIIHGDVKLENMPLDNHGPVRLCDFGEGRYIDEDERIWHGASTMHFESPNRLQRARQSRRDPPPPTVEDDMYGLGLSIWQLYTEEIPHGDVAGDDLKLKERQRKGETVDVATVQDPEARGIITGLLLSRRVERFAEEERGG